MPNELTSNKNPQNPDSAQPTFDVFKINSEASAPLTGKHEKFQSLRARYDIKICPLAETYGEEGVSYTENIAEARNKPDLGPSEWELIQAEEARDHANDVKPEKTTPKAENKPTKKEESKAVISEQVNKEVTKPIERIQDITQIEEVLKSTVTEHEREKPVAIEIKTEQTKPEELPAVRDISVLKIKHEQPVSTVKQEELIITDAVLSENIDYRVEKMEVEVAEVVPVEIVPQIQIETITVEEKVIESVDEVLNQSIEEFSNFLSDIRLELGLEVAEVVPVEVAEIIELDDASFEAPILGITEVSGADLLEELDEPVSEVAATFESDLTQLIEALEPDKAEEVIDTLHLLVKAIRNETTETDQPELVIEELFAHLLELLDLEDQDELVKKLRIMLQLPELIDKTLTDQNLTIDQLNRLGTHEYKPTTLVSIFTSLISHVKELISAQLMLGKYAIRATLA